MESLYFLYLCLNFECRSLNSDGVWAWHVIAICVSKRLLPPPPPRPHSNATSPVSAASSKRLKTKYFLSRLVHATYKAAPACLFWCIKPDPKNQPQRQTDANPWSAASHLWFISYFHLIRGCLEVSRHWQWALCCGRAVYIVLLETCWHWGGLRWTAAQLSRSGQYLDRGWPAVGRDRSARAKKGGENRHQREREHMDVGLNITYGRVTGRIFWFGDVHLFFPPIRTLITDKELHNVETWWLQRIWSERFITVFSDSTQGPKDQLFLTFLFT